MSLGRSEARPVGWDRESLGGETFGKRPSFPCLPYFAQGARLVVVTTSLDRTNPGRVAHKLPSQGPRVRSNALQSSGRQDVPTCRAGSLPRSKSLPSAWGCADYRIAAPTSGFITPRWMRAYQRPSGRLVVLWRAGLACKLENAVSNLFRPVARLDPNESAFPQTAKPHQLPAGQLPGMDLNKPRQILL